VEKNFAWAIEFQKQIATKITTHDMSYKLETFCGTDVSYKGNIAYCSAVIINSNFELIASVNVKCIVKYPYIPGLLFLRESGPLLSTLRLLRIQSDFDMLLVDGQGILHPRKCGLASYIGYAIDKPTIGVAKNILCGSFRKDHFIDYNGSILGYVYKKEGKKPIYISIGHKISLKKSIQIVQKLTKAGQRMPEPLRIADINSKNHLNFD
jgi:deoxyribonuclease V